MVASSGGGGGVMTRRPVTTRRPPVLPVCIAYRLDILLENLSISFVNLGEANSERSSHTVGRINRILDYHVRVSFCIPARVAMCRIKNYITENFVQTEISLSNRYSILNESESDTDSD